MLSYNPIILEMLAEVLVGLVIKSMIMAGNPLRVNRHTPIIAPR